MLSGYLPGVEPWTKRRRGTWGKELAKVSTSQRSAFIFKVIIQTIHFRVSFRAKVHSWPHSYRRFLNSKHKSRLKRCVFISGEWSDYYLFFGHKGWFINHIWKLFIWLIKEKFTFGPFSFPQHFIIFYVTFIWKKKTFKKYSEIDNFVFKHWADISSTSFMLGWPRSWQFLQNTVISKPHGAKSLSSVGPDNSCSMEKFWNTPDCHQSWG